MKLILGGIMSVSLALVGCSAPPYKPVEGTQLATIHVVNKSNSVIIPMESQQGDCRDMQWFGGYLERTGEHIPANESVSTKARPGHLFVLNVAGGITFMPIGSCAASGGFVPEPNGVYEVAYSISRDRCALDAVRTDISPPVSVPLSAINVHNKIGPQWCELKK